MKKYFLLTLLLSSMVLVGCGSNQASDGESKDAGTSEAVNPSSEVQPTTSEDVNPSSEVQPTTSEAVNPSSEVQPTTSETPFDPSTLPSNGIELKEGQTVKFEAENAIPTAWKNSGWGSNDTFVADDADANASGGKFVTPSTGNVDPNRKFEIVVYAPKDGDLKMQVAYCRGGKNTKTATIDYSYVYQYRLDGVEKQFTCTTSDTTDSSVASWDWKLIEFTVKVTKGLHTIAAYLDANNANTNAGCPCVDYYNFTI